MNTYLMVVEYERKFSTGGRNFTVSMPFMAPNNATAEQMFDDACKYLINHYEAILYEPLVVGGYTVLKRVP